MKMTGVSGIISSAHYDRSGILHGHTWHVLVWFVSGDFAFDAVAKKLEVGEYLSQFDHSILPDGLTWGEHLAERIGTDLGADSVELSRQLEGIYAKWVRS